MSNRIGLLLMSVLMEVSSFLLIDHLTLWTMMILSWSVVRATNLHGVQPLTLLGLICIMLVDRLILRLVLIVKYIE